MSSLLLAWLLVAGAPEAESRVLASPGLHALSLQLGGIRRRLAIHGVPPAWQYDFGAAYVRLWRLRPPSAHLLGVRTAVSVPGFDGVEVAPQVEYRYGDLTTVNVSLGPMWQVDSARKGAGGLRTEMSVTAPHLPWSVYVGASHAFFGRPALALTFGVRFEVQAHRPPGGGA